MARPGIFFRHCARRIVIKIDNGVLAVMFDQSAIARHGGRWRIYVGHADRQGHAARRRGHRRGGDIFFMGKTRVSMMRMRIDQPRNDFLPLSIDNRVGAFR